MVSSGQLGTAEDEWDEVWQDYDRRRPTAVQPPPEIRPAPPSAASQRQRQRRNRGYGALLAVAACLIFAPRPGLPEASRYPSPAETLTSLASLAPEEAELPPLTFAVSRLAAESAAAACWVMRLAPQAAPWGKPCVEP